MDTFKFKNLSKHKNIVHGISTRKFGSMKNEDGSINKKNLKNFLESLGLAKNSVSMGQIHSGNVEIVSTNTKTIFKNTDGLITNRKDIFLCVLTADCLPVLFYNPKNKIIGIAHCGRKGLQNKIIENIIDKFKSVFGSDPKNIIVGIGPGIEKKCYEVDGKLIDIIKIATESLLRTGIRQKNIEIIDICTKCNMREFYSYRGGNKYKRFASVICLK